MQELDGRTSDWAVQRASAHPLQYNDDAFVVRTLDVRAVFTFEPLPNCAWGNDVASFVARSRKRDVYFLLGEAKGSLSKKPRKDDMAGSKRLWVDRDPPPSVWDKKTEHEVLPGALAAWRERTQAAISALDPAPTFVIDSGRGFWVIWQLNELARPEAVEAANKALAQQSGGDSCFNIDRVARMPGTVNTKTGKTAQLVVCEPARVYKIDQFSTTATRPPGEPPAALAEATPTPVTDLADLSKFNVPALARAVILHGKDPDNADRFPSRSEAVFYVACELVRCGVPETSISGILLNTSWAISDSIYRDKSGAPILDPAGNARRQVERALNTVGQQAATRGVGAGDNFEADKHGVRYKTQHNIRVALSKLGVVVKHDTFQDRLLIEGLPDCGPILDDASMTRLWLLIEQQFKFRAAKDFFYDVICDTARCNAFHPVRHYLAGLKWDGGPRLDTWLITYGGANDTAYVRAVGSLTLMAAVRRIRQPGCKFDEIPIWEGEQGNNKSSTLGVLAGREEWFSDDLPLNVDGKRVIESLKGRWIVEAAELNGMKKGDVEHVKAFASRQIDRARMSYDRLVTEAPRQCIIVGTTNSAQYFRDATGNRRFWPVRIERFDIDALRRDRDQLWAEAAAREANGASIRLDPSLWREAAAEQQKRAVEDPFVSTLNDALADCEGKIRTTAVFELLGISADRRTQEQNARVGDAMRVLGFERKKVRFGERNPEWGYVRGDPSNEIDPNANRTM